MNIILTGAVIAILGGVISAIGTWLQNKQSSEKSTRIETGVNKANEEVIQLRKQNDELKANSESQLTKIDELRKENADLSSKLMDKSLDIYKNITGNKEKPLLIVNSTNLISGPDLSIPKYFMVGFSIENNGKYPMRNMRVRITDFSGREMILHGIRHTVHGSSIGFGVRDKESEYRNFDFNPSFDIGTLSPNPISTLLYRTTYSPESTSPSHYNVEIMWDGGYLYHFITFKTEKEKLVLQHWEALFNGKPLKDMKCIKFN